MEVIKSTKAMTEQVKQEAYFTLIFLIDFFKRPFAKKLPALKDGEKTPIILVPGFMGGTLTFKDMANKLNGLGYPVYPLHLGFQMGNILKKSNILSKFITDNKLGDVYVVAHSMGGLVSTGAMINGETRIKTLFTLGTPFFGTYGIYTMYAIFGLSSIFGVYNGSENLIWLMSVFLVPCLHQMLPSSDLLHFFNGHYNRFKNITVIASKYDQIVMPSFRDIWKPTVLDNRKDTLFEEHGHINLFMGARAIDILAEKVEADYAMATGDIKMIEPSSVKIKDALIKSITAEAKPAKTKTTKAKAPKTPQST